MRVLIINKFLYPNGGSETYIFKLGEALEQHGHEVQYFGMEHEGRCVGNRVNAYTSDMDFHGGSKLSKLTYPIKTIYSKEEIVKQRVALYEQYADGNMSKEEFIRQRDAYRVQEDERMEQIQRLRTEKDQIFQPVKKDTDNLQAVMDTVGGAGDVMHLSQNVVETFNDRIEVFNDECVKIRFTFEDVLKSYEAE